MSKELVKDDLDALTKGLTDGQKVYLYLILMDFPKYEARRIAMIKSPTVEVWEHTEPYKGIESHVLGNKGRYIEQARMNFLSTLPDAATKTLYELVNISWDKASPLDKPYIMKAIELIRRTSGGRDKPLSYDELILRRRREA